MDAPPAVTGQPCPHLYVGSESRLLAWAVPAGPPPAPRRRGLQDPHRMSRAGAGPRRFFPGGLGWGAGARPGGTRRERPELHPSRRPGHRGRSHHGALSSSRGGFSGCLKSAHGPTWERARAGLAAAGSCTCPRRARQALRGFARRRMSVSVREASSSPFPGKGPQQHGAAGPGVPHSGVWGGASFDQTR